MTEVLHPFRVPLSNGKIIAMCYLVCVCQQLAGKRARVGSGDVIIASPFLLLFPGENLVS